MYISMVSQKIFRSVVITTLICFSPVVFAAGDSARIGIKVEIKSKQGCEYTYALASNAKLQYSERTDFSNCDTSTIQLQQQVDQVVGSEFRTTESISGEKRLRVFMVVQ